MPIMNTMDDNLTITTTEATTTTATATATTATIPASTMAAGYTGPDEGGGDSNKVIIAVAAGVACAAVILIIVIAVVLYLRKKRRDRERLRRGSVLPDPNVIDRVNHGFDDESEIIDTITDGSLPSPPNGVHPPVTQETNGQAVPEGDKITNVPSRKSSRPGFMAVEDIVVLPPSPAPHVHGAARYVNTGPERIRENPELHLENNNGGSTAAHRNLSLSVMAPSPEPHISITHRSYVNTGKDKELHNPDRTPPRKPKKDYVNVSEWVERPSTKRVPSMVPPEDVVGNNDTEQLPVYANL